MEFLPLNLGGVFRPLRFVNGLVAGDINPIVVSFADDANLRKVQNRFDYGLLDKLDKNITVYRVPLDDMDPFYKTRIRRFKNIYFNPTDNYYKAWKKNVFRQLPEIIEKHKPTAVFVTCPPFSAAELGSDISKKFGLPLILDMRDAWAKLSMAPLGSWLHYIYKKNREYRVFKQAKAIITVTPQLQKIFQNTHPEIPADKFHLIFNGFEFELPDDLRVRSQPISEKGELHIGYTGSFYYSPQGRDMMLKPWWRKKGHRIFQYTPVKEDWLYRSPYFFLKSLAGLLNKRPELKKSIFFHLIGDTPDWLEGMASEWGLRENLVLHGYQTHQKALELQESFDFFLATSEKVMGNDHYCLPSKLFTYLRTGKPVLGYVTKGIQYDFIYQSGLGPIADPDDELAGSLMLEKIVEEGWDRKLNTDYLKQYSNPVAINKLKDIIKQVTGDE
jgi:Glycosyltransferase Family 4